MRKTPYTRVKIISSNFSYKEGEEYDVYSNPGDRTFYKVPQSETLILKEDCVLIKRLVPQAAKEVTLQELTDAQTNEELINLRKQLVDKNKELGKLRGGTGRKELGKIISVKFGHCGYQDAMIGIQVTLGDGGWGCGDSRCAWDAEIIEHTEYCKWTEESRDGEYAAIMRYVSKLLKDAKVDSVDKLKNIPIEATFDGAILKEWRILTEVL